MNHSGRNRNSQNLVNPPPQLARDILLSQEDLAAKRITFSFASIVTVKELMKRQ